MRLLDINSYYSDSGGGVHTYHKRKLEYFSHIPEIEYTLVVSSNRNSVEKVPGGKIYRLKGFPMLKGADYRQIYDLLGFKQIVETEKPHVIEIGSCYFDNWIAKYSTMLKDTVTAGFYHADAPDSYIAPAMKDFPKALTRGFVGFWHSYVKWVYSMFDATCVTSKYMEQKLNSWGLSNTWHNPLGVDTERFSPKWYAKEMREELGVNENEKLLLYVGRFSPEKGIETMLEALPRISAEPNVKVAIVGDGQIADRVQKAVAPLPNVQLCGFTRNQERLAKIFASADIFLSPGPYETFGLSTLEAMSSGVPVVAASTGGAAELVRDCQGGILFEKNNPSSMVETVSKLLQRDYKPIGERASRIVKSRYSWDQTFANMIEFYGQLITEKQSGIKKASLTSEAIA